MRVLGAVLAGGRARRFGSDKALALLAGKPLIEHVIEALAVQTDAVAVCGRDMPGRLCFSDWPAPDLGPLGGLAAALRYGAASGFEAILTAACDTPLLPTDLMTRLQGEGASIVAGQPLIGFWPAALSDRLTEHLENTADRSMRTWVKASGARQVAFPGPIPNVNAPADLASLEKALRRAESG